MGHGHQAAAVVARPTPQLRQPVEVEVVVGWSRSSTSGSAARPPRAPRAPPRPPRSGGLGRLRGIGDRAGAGRLALNRARVG